MIVPLNSNFRHLYMKTNEITTKQTIHVQPTIKILKARNMFKINTKGSNVSICAFKQVNLCIYNVT